LSTAAIPDIGAVVADSAFADVRDVMDAEIEARTGIPALLIKLLRPGLGFVARLRYSLDLDAIAPERAVPNIAPRPILFIHGSEDPVIPLKHAHRLKAASMNADDELWMLPEFGHTECVRFGHTECVRMGAEQEEVSPMRETCLSKLTAFFHRSLS
jgi:fermentation-respiration switch protein FrsA (DUF1100 family)